MKLRMALGSRRKLSRLLSQWCRVSDGVFAFDRLMLFDEEHSDPVALTEILLETCSSITHSLGKWTSPGLCLVMNCLLTHSYSGAWLVEEVQSKHKLSEITFCPSVRCAVIILILSSC